jgi:hypothetical protein
MQPRSASPQRTQGKAKVYIGATERTTIIQAVGMQKPIRGGKVSAMAITKTQAKKELQAIINELVDKVPCTFWACPGPNKPEEPMMTCTVCSIIKRLRRLKRNL